MSTSARATAAAPARAGAVRAARVELIVVAALAVLAVAAWAIVPTYPNYDTYYHLVWGRELLDGTKPSFTAYAAPIRLILGGRAKGEDFEPFARELPENVASIYLVGEAADELAQALDAAEREYTRAGTIERAVELAAAVARSGDVVLLSPACASYDQFENFERRGEEFGRLVANLP